uniref:F-box domain-containing protein n=1 Tax=Leersia perrieri TaxID=77586 RepID=A0A0D9XPG4_9ORYZ
MEESTSAVPVKKGRPPRRIRRRPRRRHHHPRSTPSDHRRHGDLISDLNDDVLTHVLSFLPTTADVARACAVSRRWRRLATRVPSLTFSSRIQHDLPKEKVYRLIAFINHVLAARAAADVEHLSISLDFWFADDIAAAASAQLDAWIRYGMRHVSKSFSLKLTPDYHRNFIINNDGNDDDSLFLEVIPSYTELETMTLSLDNATLNLPNVVKFNSLKHLTLEHIRLAAGSSRLLGRLMSSSCCPHLQKLELTWIAGLTELHIDSGELLELSLLQRYDYSAIAELHLLELNTPKLRDLGVQNCYLQKLIIDAPRLEDLSLSTMWSFNDIEQLGVSELSHVRKLLGIKMTTHGHHLHDRHVNDCAILLLRQCTSVEFVGFSLRFTQGYYAEEEEVDMMKEIPSLPHVTKLWLSFFPQHEHTIIASIACLFTRCSSLKYLMLHMVNGTEREGGDQAISEDHPSIKLPNLQEIEILGFQARQCEASLVKWLHTTAPALKRIKLVFSYRFRKSSIKKLRKKLPFAEVGTWSSVPTDKCNREFEWTPMCEENM